MCPEPVDRCALSLSKGIRGFADERAGVVVTVTGMMVALCGLGFAAVNLVFSKDAAADRGAARDVAR